MKKIKRKFQTDNSLPEKVIKLKDVPDPSNNVNLPEIERIKLIQQLNLCQKELEATKQDLQITKESELHFKEFFENAADAIFIADIDTGIILDSNKAASLLMQMPHNKIAGLHQSQLHPSDKIDYTKDTFAQHQQEITKMVPVHPIENKILRSDGSDVPIEILATKVTFNGKQCLMGTFRDITDRKKAVEALRESQALYHSFVEHIPAGVFRKDAEGRYIFVNDIFCRHKGLKEEDVLGKSPHELADYESEIESSTQPGNKLKQRTLADLGENHHRLIMQTGKPVEIEEVYTNHDHTKQYLQVVKSPVFSSNGKVIGTQGIQFDITERKLAEERLVLLNKQLKELNTTKDKLFSIIAHDLRSPFNSILGFSDLLYKNLRKYDIQKTEKAIEQINSAAKNTLNLLDNLLAWAITQTGQLEFKPEKICLSPIIHEIITVLNSSARIKNITLNTIQSNELEVYADQNMLQTIIRNLISNAIKFTRVNGRVDIDAINLQNRVQITVSDNGLGISMETQRKLFNLDTNITSSGTANEKGSGLGLLICKEFIERHKGKIWIESEPEKGSKFHIELPGIENN